MLQAMVNWWAVLAAAVANLVLGSVWYSQKVLGKPWMALVGITPDSAKGGAGKAIAGAFVASLVTAYVLAAVVDFSQAATAVEGALAGVWVWIGFVAAISISDVLFAHRPWKLFAINNAYQLVSLMMMGAILAAWM